MIIIERIISQQERISRAEEIYNRRKIDRGIRVPEKMVNKKAKKKRGYFKKFIFCINIYIIVIVAQNYNYIFSEDIIHKTQEILTYNVKVGEIYTKVVEGFVSIKNDVNSFFTQNKRQSTEEDSVGNGEMEGISQEEQINQEDDVISKNENEGAGIGGGPEEEVEKVEKTQMEIDAEYIKENCNLSLPIKGVVTSRFGVRESTDIISSNHKGIDIGANLGSIIKSSMDGVVTDVLTDEYYGKYLKVQDGEITTVYAHCQSIYVRKGDNVKLGQNIAEVGVTGKTTGPHLHFEIRRENRVVNPEYILTF
ncbi:MAG: M23 family metallopeptidase [Clostridia bacterium]|nr:M23 family metallopeptidase [Clostridia bacterium]